MDDRNKMNGSLDLLASAMRDVFSEAMISVRNGMKADLKDMEGRLNLRIDETNARIGTTNQNMAAMFSEQEKKVGEMMDKKLDRRTEASI